jgi:hypothetical protein
VYQLFYPWELLDLAMVSRQQWVETRPHRRMPRRHIRVCHEMAPQLLYFFRCIFNQGLWDVVGHWTFDISIPYDFVLRRHGSLLTDRSELVYSTIPRDAWSFTLERTRRPLPYWPIRRISDEPSLRELLADPNWPLFLAHAGTYRDYPSVKETKQEGPIPISER